MERQGLTFNIGDNQGVLRPEQLIEVLSAVIESAKIGLVQITNSNAKWEEMVEAWPHMGQLAKNKQDYLAATDVCIRILWEWQQEEQKKVIDSGKKLEVVVLDDLIPLVTNVLEWQRARAIQAAEKKVTNKKKMKELANFKKKLLKAHEAGEDCKELAEEYIDMLYEDSQDMQKKKAAQSEE